MRKLAFLATVTAFLAAMIAAPAAVALDEPMTNFELADLMVSILGTQLPDGAEDLPAAEYYEAMAAALAEVGITVFMNSAPDAPVTCEEFTELVYPIVGGVEPSAINEKLAFLVENIGMPEISLDKTLALSEAAQILNNPAVAPLIVEAYRSPLFTSESGLAPGFILEDTASKI
jgi:hypothetical protein